MYIQYSVTLLSQDKITSIWVSLRYKILIKPILDILVQTFNYVCVKQVQTSASAALFHFLKHYFHLTLR